MRKPTTWKKHKLTLVRDGEKSYVYVEDNGKTIGMFAWDPKKQKYVYENFFKETIKGVKKRLKEYQ